MGADELDGLIAIADELTAVGMTLKSLPGAPENVEERLFRAMLRLNRAKIALDEEHSRYKLRAVHQKLNRILNGVPRVLICDACGEHLDEPELNDRRCYTCQQMLEKAEDEHTN